MRRQTRIRLCFVLVLVGLLAGIFATPTPQQNAYAAPCCSSCELQYDACLAGTHWTICHATDPCCSNHAASCYSVCNGGC
jgi:hypothetical protein